VALRILLINNYGYVRGGSDRYFLDLSALLERNGHQLSYMVSTSDKNLIDSNYAVLGFSVESPSIADIPSFFYSRQAAAQLRRLIERERPDVAHLHIYYGQLTAAILPVLKEYGIPVVQTLHEYKLLCPVATMTRQGRECNACAGGDYWHAAWHRCNRGSLARSLVTAMEAYASDMLGARTDIDHFIAVSDFVRNKMIEHGIPQNKITTVHNFVRDEVFADNSNEGRYFLYFGRIEKIKGLETLLRAMTALPDVDLYVAGTGDAQQEMEQIAIQMGLANVHFLGFKTGQALRDLIAGAIAVVAPSEWNETFGLVLVESFAQCRPVIASRMGGMTEVVSDGDDGLLFEGGNVRELADAMAWMSSHRQRAVEMGKAGQAKVLRIFSEEKHYQDVMQVYREGVGA
jgi:glycosyltransferase involved in cell wall biosynthesis